MSCDGQKMCNLQSKHGDSNRPRPARAALRRVLSEDGFDRAERVAPKVLNSADCSTSEIFNSAERFAPEVLNRADCGSARQPRIRRGFLQTAFNSQSEQRNALCSTAWFKSARMCEDNR